MAKNFLQLQRSVQSWYSVDAGDDERLPLQVVKDLLNWARSDYLRRRESRFGERSKAFQSSLYTPDYSLATIAPDFSKPRKLWYLSEGKVQVIDWMDKDEFDQNYPYSSLLTIDGAGVMILTGGGVLQLAGGGSLQLVGNIDIESGLGSPVNWTLWNGAIVLGPAPDSIISFFLDYYGTGTDWVNDTDTDLFTQQADQYLIFKALSGVSLFDIEDDRVPLWEAKALMLEQALDLEDSRQHSVVRRPQAQEPG